MQRCWRIFLSEVAGNKWQAPIRNGSGGMGWNSLSFFKYVLRLK